MIVATLELLTFAVALIATQKENIARIIKSPTEDQLRSRPSVRL